MDPVLHLPLAAVNFATLPGQFVNGLLLGAIYALIALGYTMVYGVLKLINFAHGEVYMLGGYVALFASYLLGYTPTASGEPHPILSDGGIMSLGIGFLVVGLIGLGVNYAIKNSTVLLRLVSVFFLALGGLFIIISKFQPRALNLVIM